MPSSQFVPLPVSGDDTNYRVNGAKFQAVGHGNTKSNYDSSDHLLQVALDYVDQVTCTAFASVKGGHICTKGDYNSTSGLHGAICQGTLVDRYSGLMAPNTDKLALRALDQAFVATLQSLSMGCLLRY